MAVLLGLLIIAVVYGALIATPDDKAKSRALIEKLEPWAVGLTLLIVGALSWGWIASQLG